MFFSHEHPAAHVGLVSWLRHATAAEATAAAAREGLPLIRSTASVTGYLNVFARSEAGRSGYFAVSSTSDGRGRTHMACDTPEAGAYAVARHMGKEAAHVAAARYAKREEFEDVVEMTADEAVAAALEEGLPLVRSAASSAGYLNVGFHEPSGKYIARVNRCSSDVCRISCATPEAAALMVAREMGKEAAHAAVVTSEVRSAKREELKDVMEMTADQAVAAAAEEGLPLVRANGRTGFRNVELNHGHFRVREQPSDLDVRGFASAEGAALAHARHIGKEAATKGAAKFTLGERLGVAAVASMTTEEASATAAAEGLSLMATDVASGYRDVVHNRHLHQSGSMYGSGSYTACIRVDGALWSWSSFMAAEGAALIVARHLNTNKEAAAKATKAARAEEVRLQRQATLAEKEAAREEAARQRQVSKEAAKVEAARQRQAAKEAAIQHRRQLEAHRARMAARQGELLREAAARQQRQRTGGAAPPPTAPPATGVAPPGLVLPGGPMDALVQQVLGEGCSFRRLGLEPGAPPEAVRKRYLQLALRMHPDKASHPRAQEAFTALESAYSAAHPGLW